MPELFNITPRAKEDLRKIWNYSVETWNEEQANLYVRKLYDRFSWLAARPQLGKHRQDIAQGYYCFSQGRHLVFYLICKQGEGIDIIGIVHKEMDILHYFDGED